MTFVFPWTEKGDFVHRSIEKWAEKRGVSWSTAILDALEWYFTNKTPLEFYEAVNEEIRREEFIRLHRPDGTGICSRLSCEKCYSRRNAMYAERKAAHRSGQG